MITNNHDRILIIGGNSQDGALLVRYLREYSYKDIFVTCKSRKMSGSWRLRQVGVFDSVKCIELDLENPGAVSTLIRELIPDVIYLMAGNTFTRKPDEQPSSALQVNLIAATSALEAVRDSCPTSKILLPNSILALNYSLQAIRHSAEMVYPCASSIYALSKRAVAEVASLFRAKYGILAYNCFLSNHESYLRGKEFVTQKIAIGLVKYMAGNASAPLLLGNLNSLCDWSAAEDFVEGFHKILLHKPPGDYLFASGSYHSVKEYLEKALSFLGIEYDLSIGNGKYHYTVRGESVVIGDDLPTVPRETPYPNT